MGTEEMAQWLCGCCSSGTTVPSTASGILQSPVSLALHRRHTLTQKQTQVDTHKGKKHLQDLTGYKLDQ